MDLKPKWVDYDLDNAYYMKAIESEINNILDVAQNQLKLF